MSEAQKSIHVVINPAAGKDEPILNVINDIFHKYGVRWGVSVTQKYGEATEFARAAAAEALILLPVMAATALSMKLQMEFWVQGLLWVSYPGVLATTFQKN